MRKEEIQKKSKKAIEKAEKRRKAEKTKKNEFSYFFKQKIRNDEKNQIRKGK